MDLEANVGVLPKALDVTIGQTGAQTGADVGLSVLVIDDDAALRESLEVYLKECGWQVEVLCRAQPLISTLAEFAADVVLTDLRLPGMDGIEVVEQMQQSGAPPVVVMTAHGDVPQAVEAIQKGALNFVEKPFDPKELLTILTQAARQHRLSHKMRNLKARLARLSGLDRLYLGETPAAEEVRNTVLDLADISAPILLKGETGTGKELIAHALHDLGPNADDTVRRHIKLDIRAA